MRFVLFKKDNIEQVYVIGKNRKTNLAEGMPNT